MPRLLWTDDALEDMMKIYVYIGVNNPDAAERFYTKLEDRAKSLLVYPRLGVRRRELKSSARLLIEGVYFIFYRTHPDTDSGDVDSVEIMRVVQGSQDLTRLL
jgi:toxin ParE1/3/4